MDRVYVEAKMANLKRGKKELAALTALEESTHQLATEFLGQRALNFYHESELAAHLLVALRNSPDVSEFVNKTCMYLAHLEWPCLEKKFIDLVLWRPGTCEQAIQLWRGRSNCAKNLPLLAAVQIKRGPGKLTSWLGTKKDTDNLETLHGFENLEKPTLYFVEWVDHGLQKHKNDRKAYNDIQSRLKEWCGESTSRRAFVLSRDKVGFAYPEGAWLINPLPNGVRQNLE